VAAQHGGIKGSVAAAMCGGGGSLTEALWWRWRRSAQVAAAARVGSFAAVRWRDGINGKMTVETAAHRNAG
jgi:hypothetical protein